MKKGQIYQGVAGEIRFPNRAVVETAEGEQCLVDNVLPGQKVEFLTKAAEQIAQLDNPVEQDVYISQLSRELELLRFDLC